MPGSEVWVPIATLVGGAGLNEASWWLRDARADRRRRTHRNDERQNRREGFQRDTLISLQEALSDYGRAQGRMQHQDEMAFRASGRWGQNLEPEPNQQEAEAARTREMIVLVSRVDDAEVRDLIERASSHGASRAFAQSQQAAQAHLEESSSAGRCALVRMGELIRELDGGRPSTA